MKIVRKPPRDQWESMVARPTRAGLEREVEPIVRRVREEGDEALRALTLKYDGVRLGSFEVSKEEFALAERQVDRALRDALETAYRNIHSFHARGRFQTEVIETLPGVQLWSRELPIERVGLYVPGGTAPLVSTVLMLGVPARIAGCSDVVLCTPPSQRGSVHPALLAAAKRAGIDRVLKLGGAQAIAAMAYGTESVSRVDKIFGPGNEYVNAAKLMVQREGVAIDLPAGPSEVAIIADATANPVFVAADLLAQLEHGPASQAVFLTDDEETLTAVVEEIRRQKDSLPRRKIVDVSLAHSVFALFDDLTEALDFVNTYAPEHLGIATRDSETLAERVRNAGTVLVGHLASEVLGDYAAGVNHTLPTSGSARAFSGVGVESFTKRVSFQRVTEEGLEALAPTVETLAAAEGLEAHRRAVALRRTGVSS